MHLRQLRQFVAVAEELSFRRAAQRLHMSQPPLTAAIQRLEQQIGVALLERTRHRVALTAAGAAFLEEARRTLSQAQLAVETAQRAARGMIGLLRLSFVPSASFLVLPELLHEFQHRYPSVKLILRGDSSARQLEALRQRAVDLALIVPPAQGAGEDLQVEPLRKERLIVAVPAGAALARTRQVELAALRSAAFVGLPISEGPGFTGAVLAACQQAGFFPRVVQEASQMQTILALVAGGVGLALVPEAMRSVRLDSVAYVELTHSGRALHYPLALASHGTDGSPVSDAFRAVARRVARRPRATDRRSRVNAQPRG
ncbi:MAG TPA: LysR substrate-binding domain-containing protein [Burkholderiaceae bacterium]|nr:LysR substrate-binding domain-containing protein [Burkholderiaceae bacterium]